MATETVVFDPEDQGVIAEASARLSAQLERSLPKVPWLSNTGQQEAFRKMVDKVVDSAGSLDADADARNAMVFWTLTLLYANNKSVRLATASVKNWGAVVGSPVASTWLSWIGQNTHPGSVVASSYAQWK